MGKMRRDKHKKKLYNTGNANPQCTAWSRISVIKLVHLYADDMQVCV
jgi:hypothetical protein